MEKIELLPVQRLKALIERSPDLAAIFELSDAAGTGGRAMALRLIEKRSRHTPVSGSPACSLSGTASTGS